MTLADTPSTTVQRVHPGGFFWSVERGERLGSLLHLAARTHTLAVVTNSDRDADEIAERLTLSGVPVHVGTNVTDPNPAMNYGADASSCLIVTQAYAEAHDAIPAPLVVHLRCAASVRDYAKRLDALPSAVHLTFVVPEDERRSTSLRSHFLIDHGHDAPGGVDLAAVIDLTDSGKLAMVSHARRRFPLGR